MGTTLIVACSRCGGLFLAEEGQKTRTCPFCGAHVSINRARKVGSAETAFEASEILRELKSKKRFQISRHRH